MCGSRTVLSEYKYIQLTPVRAHTHSTVSVPFRQNSGLNVPSTWSKFKFVPPFLLGLFKFLLFNIIMGQGCLFDSLSVCSSLVYKCGSQVKAISPGWFGPQVLPLLHVILPGWTNSSGQEEEERGGKDWGVRSGDCHTLLCGRLGGPDAGGSEGAFFLVVLGQQNGDSCCCLGGLFTVRLYRTPSLKSLATIPQNGCHSFSLTRPSISTARSAGGMECFIDAQESEPTFQPEEERSFIVLPSRSAFYCH